MAKEKGGSMQGEFPREDAATPGTRCAQRIDNKYPSEPPGGGEGDGRKGHVGNHAGRLGREGKGEEAFES